MVSKGSIFVALVVLLTGAGCFLFQRPLPPPLAAAYHAPGLDFNSFCRILLVPLANESPFPCAGEEIRAALAAELQCVGRFEIVAPPPCPELCPFQAVHAHGRFDEAVCIEVAHLYKVDAILAGAVTQYRPYPPPHIGLSLQLIRPAEGIVVASVDGLWDARSKELASAARAYTSQIAHLFQLPLEDDIALASPQLFQRFVCHQVVEALLEQAPPPAAAPAGQVKNAQDPRLEKLPAPRLLPAGNAPSAEGLQLERLPAPSK